MRLLILGINYAPEIISTAVYTTGLAEFMAGQGDDVEVVTALPYYPAWRLPEGWRQGWRRMWRNGVRVTHCPHYIPAKPTAARRLLHHLSFVIAAFPPMIWSALARRPDVVLVIAPALLSAPLGWLAARLAGAKTWLHIQDFEVEAAFATGLLRRESGTGRLALWFTRWLLRRFDKVSSISEPMLEKLRQQGIPEDRIQELRNWANLEAVAPLESTSPLRQEFGITTPFVVLYAGGLANKQGLEIIPETAWLLRHRKDVTFVICGDGPTRSALEFAAAGLGNIRFLPLQPLDRLSVLLGMADLHLLPQIAGAADLVLPSKLTNMLASGRPVIATADADTALGHEVAGCGALTPPGNADALAQAIETLLDAPEERIRLGAAARARALARWDEAEILGRLRHEMLRLNAPTRLAGTSVALRRGR